MFIPPCQISVDIFNNNTSARFVLHFVFAIIIILQSIRNALHREIFTTIGRSRSVSSSVHQLYKYFHGEGLKY